MMATKLRTLLLLSDQVRIQEKPQPGKNVLFAERIV